MGGGQKPGQSSPEFKTRGIGSKNGVEIMGAAAPRTGSRFCWTLNFVQGPPGSRLPTVKRFNSKFEARTIHFSDLLINSQDMYCKKF